MASMKYKVAGIAIGTFLVLVVLGFLALRMGLRRLAEEDVPVEMKIILVALNIYAEANHGFFPDADGAAGISRLFDTGIIPWSGREHIHHPLVSLRAEPGSPITEAEVGYSYLAGHRRAEPADTIILIEKTRESCDDGCVGYVDGRAIRIFGEQWRQVRPNSRNRREQTLTVHLRRGDGAPGSRF